jgi:carbonic anhydrase
MNRNAAVAYAIHNLGVKHIVVLGHYGCKGVHAAMTSQTMAVDRAVEPWLKPVQNVFTKSKRYGWPSVKSVDTPHILIFQESKSRNFAIR